MIFTRLYAELLQTDPHMDEHIRAIVLSGAPLGSMKELFESQSGSEEERKEFWDAYARKDDKYFLELGDTGYLWIEEAVNSAPLNETFKKLADLEPRAKAPIHFLHGIQDEGVSILPIKELEAWNKVRKEKKLGSLNMFARYYESGHFGNNASAIDTIGIMLFHWR